MGDRAVSFSPKEGGTVSLRVTAPNEMTGTWTTAQGAASQVRFRRWEPTTTFDRDYSGRGEDRMSQCVGFLAKLQVRNSSLNGTFESNYLATSRIFDAMGSVWSNGELDLTAYDKDGTVAWVSRGKVENGRMRVTLKGGVNCGDLEFDLR